VDFAASKAGAERLLDEACAAASKAGIAADRVLIDNSDGTFADHLGAQAKAWGADLIVVGTNNRTGLRRLLLGSDARNILRTASTPVMVVRAVDGTPPGEPDRQA
jgi:nucleotide-binding universal stress UspA family protein